MLVIGSRGSKLALWQAEHIQNRLQSLGHECRIQVIQTTGDTFQSGPLKSIGNKGLFTKEIETALLEHQIDLAVHSLKDMPTELPEGLTIAATPEREDVRDALIGFNLSDLPERARVGTGSLRRSAQLAHLRPDLQIEGIRGNVDTRLRKLDEGQFDAILLAAAGLSRLGWKQRIAEYLSPEQMCPAVGQGALALETRLDDGPGYRACLALDYRPTRVAITAERSVLDVLGGGCQLPVGALATVRGNELSLTAVVVSPDGKQLIRRNTSGLAEEAQKLGRELGTALLENGAEGILASVRSSAA